MEKLKDSLGIKGTLRILDANTRTILYQKDNMVVNLGLAYIVDRMKTVPPDPIGWIEVGTGTTPVDPLDTALETPLLRKAVTDLDTDNNILTVETLYARFEAIAVWKECGMFNASSGGTMVNRINIDFNKTGDDAVIVQFTVTLNRF